MGSLEVLTLIFVLCKMGGILAWSWAQVFIPMYIAVSIYTIMFILFLFTASSMNSKRF